MLNRLSSVSRKYWLRREANHRGIAVMRDSRPNRRAQSAATQTVHEARRFAPSSFKRNKPRPLPSGCTVDVYRGNDLLLGQTVALKLSHDPMDVR